MADQQIDAEYVISRLEQAALHMMAMPGGSGSPKKLGAQSYGFVAEFVEGLTDKGGAGGSERVRQPSPTATEITHMDQALGWLRLISNPVVRRIVAARSLTKPHTGRHVYSWRAIASLVDADPRAVQRWHAAGVDGIVKGLAG